MYFSLQYLLYSDAVVLRYIAPILTGFSGAIFLKERLFLKQFVAGLCSLFGVALVARPQFLFGGLAGNLLDVVTPQQRMISVIAALVGVVGATGTHTVLRAIGKRAHPLHVNALFSSQCVLFSTIGMRIFRISPVIPTRVLWLAIMFFVGVLSLIGQTLLTMGFQRETVSRGSLAGYTSLVFAVFFQYVVFHTTPTSLSIAGATVIMSVAIYVSLTKQTTTSTQPATSASFERGPPATSARDDDREAR